MNQKNKLFILLFFCLIIFAFARPSLALTVQEIPNPQQVYGGWVSDTANLLAPKTEVKLNRKISNLEQTNSNEIAIVTVAETAPVSPKEFATELFNYWGIGKKGRNNGVLFLISKNERRVEIETGYGVEKVLANEEIAKIIDRQIIPYFKQGNFDRGTLVGTEKIILALKEVQVSSTNSDRTREKYRPKPTIIIIFFLVPLLALSGLVLILIRQSLSPDFVEPGKRSRIYTNTIYKPLNCANCKQPMQQLDSQSIVSNLSLAERTAQKIGSVKFEPWQCDRCNNNSDFKNLHIRAYVINNDRFKTCPNCKEFTVEKDAKTLESPTRNKSGKLLISEKCQCCDYLKESIAIVPQISDSGYSGYYGGSGSGGGSFGGGGSDGGGAGGSF